MESFSYHIFYFPFRWSLESSKNKPFSIQCNLENVPVSGLSMWERVQLDHSQTKVPLSESEIKEAKELFGEQQYFFEFVHPVIYDIKGNHSSLIHHYERKEPKSRNVYYIIKVKDKTYKLRIDALNLNIYSTGVGIMSFYLSNEEEYQKDELSVRDINQFGRRIMPPHSREFNPENRSMLATSISITGLDGNPSAYSDDFNYKEHPLNNERDMSHIWQPALFIKNLIKDLSEQLEISSIIDDRMLVNCWYGDDDLSKEVVNTAKDEKDKFVKGEFWYKYVFVDNGNSPDDETCQNESMKEELLKESTYFRWQKQGSLYGASRYSLVLLTDRSWFATNVLAMHMRTIYSRMFELIIIQRASMLRFSSEVTKVSGLTGHSNKEVAMHISSLYKEYIRFVNQIYFRNVTVQDQGIELYDMLMKQFASKEQIKDLDEEISELYQYITLLVDQNRNENGEKLNLLAAAFLPATLLSGFLGMNRACELEARMDFWIHITVILIISVIAFYFIKKWRK